MKYIEVETPYGLQKYPAYGIGGFVKDVLGGLKKVAKKIAPFAPLALSFVPGFQALAPLSKGILSGLSSAAAAKLAGADTDDAIRSGLLVGGTSMLPSLFGGQKLTEGAKIRDVLSKDRGYLKGLFTDYQAPTPFRPTGLEGSPELSGQVGQPVGEFTQGLSKDQISTYSKNLGIPESRVDDFLKSYDKTKAIPEFADVSVTDYVDTYKRSLPLTERVKDVLGTPLGKTVATAAVSPILAAALDPQKDETTSPISRETGEDYITRDPLKYIVQNLQNVKYTPEGRIDFSGSRTAAQGGIMSEAPKKYAMGSNPMNQFVPRNGLIPSMEEQGENGVSDNVKALLSPDEFVFTKQAVQAAGGGDVMAGAKRLMAQMKQLEARGAQMGIGKA
jgi:hypothetical protein